MTLEQMLENYNSLKKLSKNVPGALTEQDVQGRAADPAFQRRQEQAAAYMERINELHRLSQEGEKTRHFNSNLSRFEMHNLRTETTPEARELNNDFNDMLYSPEGQQWLADHTLRATLGADLSLAYPTTADEAFANAIAHPSACEQMMAVVKVSENNNGYTINPLVAEQLKYNTTSMENAAFGQAMVQYYSSDLCCAFSTDINSASMPGLLTNFAASDLKEKNNDLIWGVFGQMTRFNDGNNEAKINIVRQLKDEGVIGPESMFYRAFDENGKRINFDDAVIKRSQGQRIEFRKMDEAEQAVMREAMAHPTTLRKQDPGALFGKDFQNECRNLYEALNGVDRALVRSSEQFRTLKKSLKEMSERKTIPNADQAKQFLHDAVVLTSTYITSKNNSKNKVSDYARNRLDTLKRVHASLSAKLGTLAFRDYVTKTAARDINERNQENIGKALDEQRQQAAAQVEEQKAAAQQQPAVENKRPVSDLDAAFSDLGDSIEPIGKTNGSDADFTADEIGEVLGSIGKREEETYAFDENVEVDPNFLSDVEDEKITFLDELSDRSRFEQKLTGIKLNATAERNVRALYEKAVTARQTLEDRCTSALGQIDAYEMKDIVGYGIVMKGLEFDPRYPLNQILAHQDMTQLDPGVLLSRNLRQYYAKLHSVEVVKEMLTDNGKLEHTCYGGWKDENLSIEKQVAAQRESAARSAQTGKQLDQNQKGRSNEASVGGK